MAVAGLLVSVLLLLLLLLTLSSQTGTLEQSKAAAAESININTMSPGSTIHCSRGVLPENLPKFCCRGVEVVSWSRTCCKRMSWLLMNTESFVIVLVLGTFSCGSTSLPCSAVNDDYCDCLHGEDEPGTAACGAQGVHFRCPNGDMISAAFVDDGVCDCCDGADETKPCATSC